MIDSSIGRLTAGRRSSSNPPSCGSSRRRSGTSWTPSCLGRSFVSAVLFGFAACFFRKL